MPEFGLLTADELGSTTPAIAPLYPPLPWSLPGVRVVKLAFEIDLDMVRASLPTTLSRPTPPFGTLVVQDVPDSPFGPFRFAAQGIACRYRTFARVFVLQAVVDNPVALSALREVLSYPAKPGVVELDDDREGHAMSGTVSSPTGVQLSQWRMEQLQGAEAERIFLDPELTLVLSPRFATTVEPAPPRLLQLNRAYALRDPRRGQAHVEFSSDDGYPWGSVGVTNQIIGIDTYADVELDVSEYVIEYGGE